jgi:hypothetical protein
MANGRCRMHGGTNPGAPKGSLGPLRHGNRSRAAEIERATAKGTRIVLAAMVEIAGRTARGAGQRKNRSKLDLAPENGAQRPGIILLGNHRQRAGTPVADRPHGVVLRPACYRIDGRGLDAAVHCPKQQFGP